MSARMDEKGGLSIRNWNFNDQAVHVPVPGRNTVVHEADDEQSALEFGNHIWVHQRNFLPGAASPNSLQSTQINTETGLPVVSNNLNMPGDVSMQNGEPGKKTKKTRKQTSTKKSNHAASKALRPKQPKKKTDGSPKKKRNYVPVAKGEKKNVDVVINGTTIDISQIPAPVCSCTGFPRQCYRWGAGGWQSSCCTTTISEYPLPMSPSRPGSRLAGRKMSNGAYAKLLQRLAAEGYDLSNTIDLKEHWAKHGTNKFVTIK
ncbi:hypothetical protein Scep_027063 [Stephania cephalantha]|uniref:GAGA-binding transcriptional activator n=1 Tax=Stephania cephalantha TaxID=152367 RepID=A0AAP0HR37_9MAGN